SGKLFGHALDTRDDPVARFVLLREARDLASRAGDVPAALRAIEEITKLYEVDALAMKTAALEAVCRSAGEAAGVPLAQSALALIDEALAADNFDGASRLADLAWVGARKGKAIELAETAETRRKEVQTERAEYMPVATALESLRATPGDPGASLVVGKH